MRAGAGKEGKRKSIAALVLLSFFWALDGLGPDLFPALRQAALPAMERQAITFGLFTIAAGVCAAVGGRKWPTGSRLVVWLGAGVLLFAVPALLAFATQAWISQLERVAIFSLTPLFAVVLEPHIGDGRRCGNGAMLGSLVAIAGVLAIFPLSVPGTLAAIVVVFALVMAALSAAAGNCLAVRAACVRGEVSLAACAVWSSGVAAIACGIAGACVEGARWRVLPNAVQVTWLVAVDVPALFLLFWLLGQMSAVRMTTRYLIAPLLTVLGGIALELPQVTARMVIGVTLLGMGAAWILIDDERDEGTGAIGIL